MAAGGRKRVQRGKISWYGSRFAGRQTASGETYDPDAFTMAHRNLPLGTLVRVTNPENNRSATVRVNDRGPVPRDRVADLSRAAATHLGIKEDGVAMAELEVVGEVTRSRPDRGDGGSSAG